MNWQLALKKLDDVPGVVGSFVASADGELLASSMPQFFDLEELRSVAPRVSSLVDSLEDAGPAAVQCVLRFAEHKLILKPIRGGALGVVAEPSVNGPALRMATRLTVRKLESSPAPASGDPSAHSLTSTGMAMPAYDPRASAEIPVVTTPEAEVPPTWRPEQLRRVAKGPPEQRGVRSRGRTIVYRGRKYEM